MSSPLRARQIQDLIVDTLLFLILAVILLSQAGCAVSPHADSVNRACRGFSHLPICITDSTIR
jgi:hypothetical protein